MEGRRPPETEPGPAHAQIVAQTRLGGAGRFVLRRLTPEQPPFLSTGNPALPVDETPQKAVLFDAPRGIGPHLEPFETARLRLADTMVRRDDHLAITLPEGLGNGWLDLFSPDVLIWPDALEGGGEVRPGLEIDPVETDALRIVLSAQRTQAGSEPGAPHLALDAVWGGWIVTQEVTAVEHEMLKDTEDFDPMRFLSLVEDKATGDNR